MNQIYKTKMKNNHLIALHLMTYKGFQTLKAIIDNNFVALISYVMIGTDKNTLNDYGKEIISLCEDNKIKYYSRGDEIIEKPKYIFTISWRWLIRNSTSRLIIFHESLLPKYRGFAPLVNQLINHESIIGVTAIFGEKEYDTGDIIAQELLEIKYPIKINEAIIQVSKLYGIIVLSILKKLKINGKIISSSKQQEENATYSLWREENDYLINWSRSSDFILRFINSVGFPYKGAATFMGGVKIRIDTVESLQDVQIENRDVGKVIYFKDKRPVVVCGRGLLKIIGARFDETGISVFPLNKFRIRFK